MFALDTKALQEQLKAKAQKVEESARAIAFEGSDLYYKQLKQNVSGLTGNKDLPNVKTGTLRDAVYQVFSKDNSGEGRAEYHISVNFKKAKHWHLVELGHKPRGKKGAKKSRGRKTNIAAAIEYGTSKRGARPFIRPVEGQVGGAALEAMKKKLAEVMNA